VAIDPVPDSSVSTVEEREVRRIVRDSEKWG